MKPILSVLFSLLVLSLALTAQAQAQTPTQTPAEKLPSAIDYLTNKTTRYQVRLLFDGHPGQPWTVLSCHEGLVREDVQTNPLGKYNYIARIQWIAAHLQGNITITTNEDGTANLEFGAFYWPTANYGNGFGTLTIGHTQMTDQVHFMAIVLKNGRAYHKSPLESGWEADQKIPSYIVEINLNPTTPCGPNDPK